MFDIFHNWNNKNIRYTDNNKKFIIYIKYTKVLLLRMENDLQLFFLFKNIYVIKKFLKNFLNN